MVLYFSGTGNSKFVAERIAEGINDKAENISQYIKEEKKAEFREDGVYVFVGPAYVSAPARTLIDFVDESSFPSGIKAYFVITCAAAIGISPVIDKKLCERKGFEYMGSATVVMPQNYIAYFKTASMDENRETVKAAIPVVDGIVEAIKNKDIIEDRKMFFMEYPSTVAVADLYYKFFMKTGKFKASDECISCQKCVRVCPLGNVSLTDGKPVWGKKCTHCMACINYCPKGAIEYGKGSKGKPRYNGPEGCL